MNNTRQIPSYKIELWQGKKNKACIVIPVINEGERIISLLKKMKTLSLSNQADIIIIDGGSTDQSLEINRLKSLDVSGLLIKTGQGKLSAQLRCAYAFAVDNDYEYIITIDGNDKDDPEAIPRFIEALSQGFDFVQASRFIKGGIAEHTPLSRHLAIRLIHAPLLSLASGYHWTDTTQGFRGYHKKILLDPKVHPFRDIFSSYELLAYLSYRIPKLGYSCLEIPTIRRYPSSGQIPTKIAGIQGNFKLIHILINACLGLYNP